MQSVRYTRTINADHKKTLAQELALARLDLHEINAQLKSLRKDAQVVVLSEYNYLIAGREFRISEIKKKECELKESAAIDANMTAELQSLEYTLKVLSKERDSMGQIVEFKR
jgi:hypothetical protein